MQCDSASSGVLWPSVHIGGVAHNGVPLVDLRLEEGPFAPVVPEDVLAGLSVLDAVADVGGCALVLDEFGSDGFSDVMCESECQLEVVDVAALRQRSFIGDQ